MPMVVKIMEWVFVAALLMVVSWRPFASYKLLLNFMVCAGSGMGVLALFFIRHAIETHSDVDNRSNLASRVTVKLRTRR